jgi:hypothetical protein
MGRAKNDYNLEELFKKYDIVRKIASDGVFEITSKQINEFREVRLMTKFDHRFQLQVVFSKHNLSILPITRGSYLISNFEVFKDFDEFEIIPEVNFPFNNELERVNYNDITSEQTMISTQGKLVIILVPQYISVWLFVSKMIHWFVIN